MSDTYYSGEPLRLVAGPQLLIDDALVEDRWRLVRVLHPPEKYVGNPVLVRNKPWEGGLIGAVVVLWDEGYGKYRMWYTCISFTKGRDDPLPKKWICYAESEDGIEWEKPRLDLYPIKGFGRTNVIFTGSGVEDSDRYGVAVDQVWKDDVETEASRRYKMLCYLGRRIGDSFRRGLSLAVSPDGLRWTLDGDKHILDYNSDTTNLAVHDPVRGRWLLYCRPRCTHATGRQPQDPVAGFYPQGRHTSRRVAVMSTRDFKSWSYPRTCFYPDEGDVADYDAFTVFRHGSHFLMLYVAMDGDGPTATKSVHLASSLDGIHWERFHTREPFIPRGAAGTWDVGQIGRLSTAAPVRQGPNLLIYYVGTTKGQYEWHGQSAVGVAMMTPERFVMQKAGDEPGYLITKEFLLEGNRLRVNSIHFRQSHLVRSLKAEIVRHPELGNHGGFKSAFAGYSLADCDDGGGATNENSGAALVTWKGSPDLTPLLGKSVYVRFEIRNMGLFAFSITRE